jgi:hypothetical protein
MQKGSLHIRSKTLGGTLKQPEEQRTVHEA